MFQIRFFKRVFALLKGSPASKQTEIMKRFYIGGITEDGIAKVGRREATAL